MSMDKTRLANTALAAMAADGMSDVDAPQVFRGNTASAARVLAEALAAGVVTEVEEHYAGGGSSTTTGTAVKQFTVGDGSSKLITIAHNLGSQNIIDVALKRIADNAQCVVGWVAPDANTITLSFGVPPAASSLVASILYIAP